MSLHLFRLDCPNDYHGDEEPIEITVEAETYEEACVLFVNELRDTYHWNFDEEDEENGGWID